MKITAVEPFVLRVPVRKPRNDVLSDKGVPGVLIHTDEGVVGTGFTGPHSFGTDLFARAIEGVYTGALIGADPTCVAHLWDVLYDSKMRGLGRGGIVARAHAAVDIALWDIAAQAARLPLWRLLGGAKPGGIPTYVTVGAIDWPLPELVRAVGALLADGWPAIKVKVGHAEVRTDVERVRALRDELGYGFRLYVDANKSWSANDAIAFAVRAEELDLGWLEEPCHPEDVAAHARVARSTTIPIALGESLHTKYEFVNFVDADAAAILQADASHVGGVTEWLAIAGLADCRSLPLIPHHSEFGRVHQHLVAGTRAATMLEYPWESPLFAEQLALRDFSIVPPETPGASTAIDPDAFRRFRTY